MVTADRPSLCRRAIWSYQQQTYPNKELIVLDSGAESIRSLLDVLPENEVRYLQVDRAPEATLGELRNHALSLATGDFIIPQWDDDDWSHPNRITIQSNVLQSGHDACALSATLVHIDEQAYFDRPYIGSLPGGVPPTIMHRSDTSMRYPPLERGEDTHYVASWRGRRFKKLPTSMAYLYIRTYHGRNTWEIEHFLRRIRNTPLDYIRFGWYKFVRRNVFAHPRFRLSEPMEAAFRTFVADSRRLQIFSPRGPVAV